MLIQRMRDGSEGIMAKIIIGLICIVFALFGFGSMTSFFSPVAKVATINGEDITLQEMELTVERRRRMLNRDDAVIDEDQLREEVLNSLIARTVLAQAASELKLHYGDSGLDADIIRSPVFMLDGQFNAQQFQQVIAGAGFTPLTYRAEMKKDKLFDQIVSGIQQSAFITQHEAKRLSGLLSQRRDIAYIQIIASDLYDHVEVSDEEVVQYYNSNLSNFVSDETIDIQYIELIRDELAARYEIDEIELEEYFDENKASYSVDETRQLAHIQIENPTGLNSETAFKKAESVYDRVASGEDFFSVAREISDDQGSKDNGGDLGFVQRGVFAPEFESVAFGLELHEVSRPVKTDLGFHIIKVLAIEEAFSPGLSEVRGEVEQAYRYMVTEEEFVNKSSRMAEMLFENYSEIESVAAALDLEIRTSENLTRHSDNSLMTAPDVSEAAFSTDVLIDGNNSDVIEVSDDYHVGLRVKKHNPSRTMSLEEVRLEVTQRVRHEKAAGLSDMKAQEIVNAIEAGSLAQFVADEYGYEWKLAPATSRFDSEVDRDILTEAFKLPRPYENKESIGSAVFPNGDSIVLRISEVFGSEEEVAEEELAAVRVGLARQSGMIDFNEFQEGRKFGAVVERVN